MSRSGIICRLFDKLSEDVWRRSNPFETDLVRAQEQLLRFDLAPDMHVTALNQWMQVSQPCIFARFAASLGLLHYTVVHDSEILDDLETAVEKVRAMRKDVGRLLYEGRSMGWVLVIVSQTLAHAAPNGAARELASRLFSSLVRGNPPGLNSGARVELDRIWLRDRTASARPFCWESPYNFFTAQADGRWWKARRFPAGWAFSLNSVGHSVAAGLMPPTAGLAWAQRTMMRTPGSTVCSSGSSYTCDYDTDTLLPVEFFEDGPSGRHGPFALTQVFERAERSAAGGSWSDPDAREDGRAFRTEASDVWFI